MKQLVFIAILFFQFLCFAQSVADLDRIQDKADGLNAFLANTELREEYLHAAQLYFGGESAFPRSSYEAILAFIEKMSQMDTTIATRAWDKKNSGPTFTLNLGTDDSLELRQDVWVKELIAVKKRVENKSGDWAYWWKEPIRGEKFVKDVEQAQLEMSDIMKNGTYSKTFLDSFIKKNETLIYALLQYQLELEDNKEGLNSSKWEVIRSVTNKLATQKHLNWPLPFSKPPQLAKYWKLIEPDFISTERSVAKYTTKISQESGRKVTFRSVRRFHALFRGLPVKECTGGDCSLLETLSARRFAIPLLNDTWVQFLEENELGEGHLQAVTLQDANSKTILNVDFMAGKLREQVTLRANTTGDAQAFSIYELWLAEVENHLDKNVQGIAIGEALNANNEKMQEFIRAKISYQLGQDIGPAERFSVTDGDMAYRISLTSWRLEKDKRYANCLTFDACDIESKHLRILNSSLQESRSLSDQELFALWTDPSVDKIRILNMASREFQARVAQNEMEVFKSLLRTIEFNEASIESYLAYLLHKRPLENNVRDSLRKSNHLFIRRGLGGLAAKKDLRDIIPSDISQVKPEFFDVFESLTPPEKAKTSGLYLAAFKAAGKLSTWDDILGFAQTHKSIFSKDSFQIFATGLAFAVKDAKPTPNQIEELGAFFTTVDSKISFLKIVAQTVTNPDDLIAVFNYKLRSPSDPFKAALSDVVVEFTEQFSKANPTPEQISSWIGFIYYVEQDIKARKILLKNLKSIEQILVVFTLNGQTNNAPYKKAIQSFLLENSIYAEPKLSDLAHFIEFLKIAPTIDYGLRLRNQALRFVKTPEELLDIYKPYLSASPEYILALKNSLAEKLDFFLLMNPSVATATRFLNEINNEEIKIRLQHYIDHVPKGFKSLIARLKNNFGFKSNQKPDALPAINRCFIFYSKKRI